MHAAKKVTSADPKKHSNVVLWVGALIMLALITAGVVAFVMHMGNSAKYQPAAIITHSTDTPEETKPDDTYAWKGTQSDPKKIAIPSIQVDGFLQNVGVDQNMLVAVPTNIHVGGWFVNSVKPGEKGLSIIDGHVDGVTSNTALFSNLHKVVSGDIVEVTSGDDTTRRFEVVRLVETTVADAPLTLYSQDPGITEQLNLITCTGTYSKNEATYDKRLIAITKLVR